jgi:pyrroline-5-carboxylate reductase
LVSNTSNASTPTIVRCMPNTPALVGEGATGVYASSTVTPAQKETAFNVLKSISKSCYWVDEERLIDVVTGVSGSGF